MPITVSGFKSYFDRVAREDEQAEVKRLRRRQDERAESQESRQESAFRAAQEDRQDTKARQKVEREQEDKLYQLELEKGLQAIRAGEDQQDMNTRSILEQDSLEMWGMGEGHVFTGGDLRGYDRMAGIKNPENWTATVIEWDKGGIPKKLEYTNNETGEKKSVNADVQFIESKKVDREAKRNRAGTTGFAKGASWEENGKQMLGLYNRATGEKVVITLGTVDPEADRVKDSTVKQTRQEFETAIMGAMKQSLPPMAAATLRDAKAETVPDAINVLEDELEAMVGNGTPDDLDPKQRAEYDQIDAAVKGLRGSMQSLNEVIAWSSLSDDNFHKAKAAWLEQNMGIGMTLAPDRTEAVNPFNNVNSGGGSGGSGLGGM